MTVTLLYSIIANWVRYFMNSKEQAQTLFNNINRIFNRPAPKKLVSLTRGELCVLAALVSHGSMTPSELVVITDTSSAHMAKILRNLSSKGEILRESDPEDGRRVIVSLTEKGRCHVRAIYESIIDHVSVVLQQLDQQDVDALIRATGNIAALQEVSDD